jgi:hypothetical protein
VENEIENKKEQCRGTPSSVPEDGFIQPKHVAPKIF